MRLFVCTLAVAMCVGCAENGDATRKELSAIQQELTRMRAENAILMARVEALETSRVRQESSSSPDKPPANADDDRPKLDVLRLSPTAEPTEPVKEEPSTPAGVDPDEPRPVIRSTGRGEVIAQSPRTPKQPSQPQPAKTAPGTAR